MNETAICPLFRASEGGAPTVVLPLLAGDEACRQICSACRCCDPAGRAGDWLVIVARALAPGEGPALRVRP